MIETQDLARQMDERNKKIADLKREHDFVFAEGMDAKELMEAKGERVIELRQQIKAIEGTEYDEIGIMFNGTFD